MRFAFLLTDQAFAAGIRRFRETGDTRNGASYFLGTGVLLWTTWQVTCFAGYWVGNVIPVAWSLEFVVPLCFLALLVPTLEDGSTRVAALAAGIAVVALDALPMRLSLICARTDRHRGGNARRKTAAPHDERVARMVDRHPRRRRAQFPVAAVVHRSFSRTSRCRRSSRAGLRFVPAAMLTAIVVPSVVFSAPGTLAFTYANPKLVAAAVAAVVAWRTKDAVATMGIGMVALWLTQWLLGAAGSTARLTPAAMRTCTMSGRLPATAMAQDSRPAPRHR